MAALHPDWLWAPPVNRGVKVEVSGYFVLGLQGFVGWDFFWFRGWVFSLFGTVWVFHILFYFV